MADTPRHLTLLVPGLSGPQSDRPVTDYFRERPLALDRLLTRSRHERMTVRGLDAVVCREFGIDSAAALPVAALTWLADCDDPLPRHLLRADPVHLRADQSCLRLFESHGVPLRADEAAQLVAAINAFNAPLGWQLSAPDPQRWYLALPQCPALITCAPQQAAGVDIDPFLPAGADAARWHATMNELQMLLHDHPVNAARAERGEPAINSLWFWGNGELPDVVQAPAAEICADLPLAQGLARHAGIRCAPVPESFARWQQGAAPLVVLDALEWPHHYSDVESWLEQFEQLDYHWLRPAATALRSGQLASITLDCCDGNRFYSDRWRQYAFWKVPGQFEDILA